MRRRSFLTMSGAAGVAMAMPGAAVASAATTRPRPAGPVRTTLAQAPCAGWPSSSVFTSGRRSYRSTWTPPPTRPSSRNSSRP